MKTQNPKPPPPTSEQISDQLQRMLASPDIRIMTLGLGNPNAETNQDAVRFVVDGSVRSDETCIKVIVNLTDTHSGHQIWSESSQSSIQAVGLIAFQEDLARLIAVKIAGERGLIMKTLDKESKRHAPQHSTAYEAVLRYFEYDVTYTPEAFLRALTALEKAVVIEPEYGPAWSMLARLYTDCQSRIARAARQYRRRPQIRRRPAQTQTRFCRTRTDTDSALY